MNLAASAAPLTIRIYKLSLCIIVTSVGCVSSGPSQQCLPVCVRLTDVGLLSLLRRCPELRALQGLHPPPGALSRRSQRGSSHASLSVAGVVTALQQCGHLRAVETSDLLLLEAVLSYLPHVDIAGTFRNRERAFPAARAAPLCVPAGARLSSLDLSGAVIAALPFLPLLHHLQLRWVRFQHAQPFHQFVAPELRTFVMHNCAGPPSALAYVPLVATLAAAGALARLELVRVPFLGQSQRPPAEADVGVWGTGVFYMILYTALHIDF